MHYCEGGVAGGRGIMLVSFRCFIPFVLEGRSNDILAKVKLVQLLFNSSLQGSILRGGGSPLIYRGDDEA
jgi:hypothetical protein